MIQRSVNSPLRAGGRRGCLCLFNLLSLALVSVLVSFLINCTNLHAAFQHELRALKASGEFARVVSSFGFDVNDRLLNATPEQACTF